MVIRVLDPVDAPKTEPGHANDSSLSTLMNEHLVVIAICTDRPCRHRVGAHFAPAD